MFQIIAENLGKKFHYEWIFRNFSYTFENNVSYAVVGNNGSGKSTLLQLLAGFLPASEGKIAYQEQGRLVDTDNFYRYVAWASPYLELIEEMTLEEIIHFHQKFRKLKLSNQELIETLRLEKSRDKLIKNFSSGMKQRLKLGLAMYSQTPILMLDEPTSNLDIENIHWYKQSILEQKKDRLVIIASNQKEEYDFCEQIITIS